MKDFLTSYKIKKDLIKARLEEFKKLKEENYLDELIFCLLTPQSNAKKCWQAVKEIKNQDVLNEKKLVQILKSKTRFHNNKARYIMEVLNNWNKIKASLNNQNKVELRNWLSENVKGFGLKEASHFLRNIGKSENKITILDRHILKNLKELKVIKTDKIKSKNHYLELEQKFLNFSKSIDISPDELDLLFWSAQTGEIFK